jgi:SAM-dependent methyltransferase
VEFVASRRHLLLNRTRGWAANSARVRHWREARYELFVELCDVQPEDRILDVGAGAGLALERFNQTNEIVALDLHPATSEYLQQSNVSVVQGDGTALPFADGEFPVVFCSSVIQDVPKDLRERFAGEVRRVGRRYFVQTPNRYFLIDPAYQLPFFHFLPTRVQRWINARMTLGWRNKGNWIETRYLSAKELRRLFPDAEIRRERLVGLTKSLMAVGRH